MGFLSATGMIMMCLAGSSGNVSIEGLADWRGREGHWEMNADEAHHADPHFHGGVLAWPGDTFGTVRIEAEVRIADVYWDVESVWAGVLVRGQQVLTDGPWGGGYSLFIRANGEAALHSPSRETLAVHQTALRPREEGVRLALEAEGSHLRGYVNGNLVVEAEDDAYRDGEVALVHYGNAAVFRAVTVKGVPVEKTQPATLLPEHPAPRNLPPVTPMPAIGVRRQGEAPAEFYQRDTGARFIPKGFNHTRLEGVSTGWHATFNVGIYDPEAMETLLTEVAAAGANTLRVWAWGVQKETGFTGAPDSRGLNGAYMENFTDFLRRATRHGIYVVSILDETPHNAYYDRIAEEAEDDDDSMITGRNRGYLAPGPLAAKATAAADFVRFVKQADEGLLKTVLGWAFANEVSVNHSQGPFNVQEGMVTTSTGRAYDMADNEQRQACYDETILHWSNALVEAVKAVAPNALTTVGMWTSDAHGRPPVNYLLPDGKDPRIPPRPSVLAGADSRLDFLDIHIYPWDGTSRVRPEAHEAQAVLASDKPVIVGEYGVFKRNTIEEARVMMREMLEQAYALGYQGSLHWVWDLTEVEGQTWSAVEEGLAAHLMALDVHPR